MTRQMESTELDAVVQLLADEGFDGMAQAIGTLMNEALKLQRSEALGAQPYERTAEQLKAMLVNQLALNPDDVVRSAHWVRDLDCL
jgi:hypothetical protein